MLLNTVKLRELFIPQNSSGGFIDVLNVANFLLQRSDLLFLPGSLGHRNTTLLRTLLARLLLNGNLNFLCPPGGSANLRLSILLFVSDGFGPRRLLLLLFGEFLGETNWALPRLAGIFWYQIYVRH
jgi:hypothetical protein